ncbi:MAG: glycosyltransferase family 2 protein [Gammaproteobacteria bacterium]|nr:glycosyltransferase family 2 protein [Gammaproteobacteria bacterium]
MTYFTNKKPGISVVIPNYNGKSLLEQNLPSIYVALEQANVEYEIIVTDDCSSDDSIEFLKSTYPDIRVISTETNLGFSGNCNNGIKNASLTLTCVTNTDVNFDINYFKNALPYFADENLFAVKGKIVNYEGDPENITTINETCLTYIKRGIIRFKCDIEPDNKKINKNIGGQYVGLGCCFVANTHHLKSIGGFYEIFSPYYWEDSDLAITALEYGYNLIYEKDCVIYHNHGSTISKTQAKLKRKIISNRNKFIFTWLHLKGIKNWIINILFIILNLFTRWIVLDIKYYISLYSAIIKFVTKQPRTSLL